MKYSFDRALMAPKIRTAIQLVLIAFFVATTAWHATARADDMLDRGVSFHIAPSPLSSALIEFSTQSGLQVAAADADVSRLNSNGVNGTYPPRVALDLLLHGTGLAFSRVGTQTIAIRSASGGPKIESLAQADATGAAPKPPAADSGKPEAGASTAPQMPDVTVIATRPPTDQELAGNSLDEFILHHATTHFMNISTAGNLARWRGGRQSICPQTMGLSPGYNAFVTARLLAIAANVGAPVQSDPQCKANVEILFTNNPQEKMDAVIKWATSPSFYNRNAGGMRKLIEYTSDHVIQGWYLTTSGGAGVLNTDIDFARLTPQPVWPQITQNYVGSTRLGSRVGSVSGSGIGIGIVILVVDTTKVVGYTVGAIADNLAMLTLSVAQSPDHCDPLPSILDLMSSKCGAREAPTGITAGDLAFLKALYYKNTGLGASLSRDQIQDNMMRQFKRQ
jgi:hypothetical protein